MAGWRGTASEILPVSRSRTILERDAGGVQRNKKEFLQQLDHFVHLDVVVMLDPVVQVRVKRKSRGLIGSPVASLCCLLVTSVCEQNVH